MLLEVHLSPSFRPFPVSFLLCRIVRVDAACSVVYTQAALTYHGVRTFTARAMAARMLFYIAKRVDVE